MHPKINLIIGFDPRFVCFFANLRLVGHASRPKWLSLFALFCLSSLFHFLTKNNPLLGFSVPGFGDILKLFGDNF